MLHSGKKTHVATLELTVCVRAGFVQTPRWDGRVYYPHNMNSKVLVLVPSHHSVMLSFQSFEAGTFHECREDFLKLYIERVRGNAIGLQVVSFCGGHLPRTDIYEYTRSLLLLFISNAVRQHEGFRAIFSFHNMSASPKKSDGGLWNCSVPYWPDFRHHFPCNLLSECLHSEDEVRVLNLSILSGSYHSLQGRWKFLSNGKFGLLGPGESHCGVTYSNVKLLTLMEFL